MGSDQTVAATTEAEQVRGAMGMIRILPAPTWLEMMHLQTITVDCMTPRAPAALQCNCFEPALSPITVGDQRGVTVPVVRQRADLFPAMRVQAGTRTKADPAVMLFADAQHPWLQPKPAAAFFTPKFNVGHPLDAAIMSRLEPSGIGGHRAPCGETGEQLRDSRETSAAPRTVFLPRQQAQLDGDHASAVLTGALHAGPFTHLRSISYWKGRD